MNSTKDVSVYVIALSKKTAQEYNNIHKNLSTIFKEVIFVTSAKSIDKNIPEPKITLPKETNLVEAHNYILNNTKSRWVCITNTTEYIKPNDFKFESSTDVIYCSKILRTNSQYVGQYIDLAPFIINPNKFKFFGETLPCITPRDNTEIKAIIAPLEVRTTLGKLINRQITYNNVNTLVKSNRGTIEEWYKIMMNLLMYGTPEDAQKTLEILNNNQSEFIKHPLRTYLLFEKIYFKGYKKHHKEIDELYIKLSPTLKTLPEFNLLQGIHSRIKGDKEKAKICFEKYATFIEREGIKRYINFIFVPEDRFAQVYIQLFQIALEEKNLDNVIKYGSKYIQNINDYSKLNTINKHLQEEKHLAVDLVKRLPRITSKDETTKFFILSHPRSGSTLLNKLIASHPDITMYGEILNGIPSFKQMSSEEVFQYYMEQNFNPIEYIERIYNQEKNTTKAVGSKLLYYQLHQDNILKELLSKGYKIIELTRENQLDRFISSQLAKQNQTFFSNNDYKIEDKVMFDPKRFEKFNQSTEELNNKFYEDHKNIIRLTYNELVSNKDEKMAEIFNFLGLPNHNTETKMRKQNTKDYSESIANYQEFSTEINDYLKSIE